MTTQITKITENNPRFFRTSSVQILKAEGSPPTGLIARILKAVRAFCEAAFALSEISLDLACARATGAPQALQTSALGSISLAQLWQYIVNTQAFFLVHTRSYFLIIPIPGAEPGNDLALLVIRGKLQTHPEPTLTRQCDSASRFLLCQ